MDVTEDVQLRVQAGVQGRSELRAAHLLAVREHAVQHPVRRSVRDQHVRVVGDGVPVPADGDRAVVEGLVGEGRRDRAAPELHAVQRDAFILQVDDAFRHHRPGLLPAFLEDEVVVAGNEDLVPVWLGGELGQEGFGLGHVALHRVVAGVDQYVSRRQPQFYVSVMGVGDADDVHIPLVGCPSCLPLFCLGVGLLQVIFKVLVGERTAVPERLGWSDRDSCSSCPCLALAILRERAQEK